MCRTPLDQRKRIRCLAAEQAIEAVNLEVDCNNQGCTFAGPKNDLEQHKKKCEYRIVKCARCATQFTECEVLAKDMLEHLIQHDDMNIYEMGGKGILHHYKARQFRREKLLGSYLVRMVCDHSLSYEYYFLILTYIRGGNLVFQVQAMGDAEFAEQYDYVISLGIGGPTRISHRGKVYSMDDNLQEWSNEEELQKYTFSVPMGQNDMGVRMLQAVPGEPHLKKLRYSFSFFSFLFSPLKMSL